jgi:hypothetical protein
MNVTQLPRQGIRHSKNLSRNSSLSFVTPSSRPLRRVGRKMTNIRYRQQKLGCPTSRSFFARCGIPRYSTSNSVGVIRRACDFFDLFVSSAYPTSCISSPKQSRHPERSASQIYRKQRALGRGVEGPRRWLAGRCSSELSGRRLLHTELPSRLHTMVDVIFKPRLQRLSDLQQFIRDGRLNCLIDRLIITNLRYLLAHAAFVIKLGNMGSGNLDNIA